MYKAAKDKLHCRFLEQYTGTKIHDADTVINELIFPINGDPALYLKTFVAAAGCDVLLDGQLGLFKKLAQHNILAKLLINNGAVHGFVTYGKEFDEDITIVLQKIKEWL